MDIRNSDKDALEALSGSVKHLVSRLPGLGEAVAGWQAYNTSQFRRNVEKVLSFLQNKVDDLQSLFSQDWLQTEDGKTFARKLFDSAFDTQQEEKQEIFVNALINGIREKNISGIEKLKFIDMLRHLSLASLYILGEMHKMFIGRVGEPITQIKREEIIQQLSGKFEPYLIESAINEMKAVGLFSSVTEWRKVGNGRITATKHFNETTDAYTDFTVKFVEFITFEKKKSLGGE